MVNGVAVKVATLDSRPIYQLYPSRGMDEQSNQYVVAKLIAPTKVHPQEHLTLMFCDSTGNTAQYGDAEALTPTLRLVGDTNVERLVENLGYVLVAPEALAELEVLGKAAALTWYRANILGPDDRAYADENWGLFAAQYLVDNQRAQAPCAQRNQVPWKSQETVAEIQSRREREAYRDYLFG
jgi:hypothetical protein